MTSDSRSPDEIERDIEVERSRLARSINQLQEKFSMDSLIRDVGEGLRKQTGDISRSIGRTVGRNPAAAIMAGAGLAWLFLGKGISGAEPDTATGRVTGRATGPNGASPYRSLPGAHPTRDRQWMHDNWADHGDEDAEGAPAPSGALDTVRDMAASAGAKVSDAAAAIADTASDLRSRLTKGTEGMTEEARRRVVSARQAAYDAQEQLSATAHQAGEKASDFFDAQPLVTGALALAVGAAIGGLAPRTRMEDETFGAGSDALFAEAQAIWASEREKAEAVLSAAAQEAGQVVKDAAESVQDRVEGLREGARKSQGEVEKAARKVADAAMTEARKQDFTKP
jgi:ElaB/YqjD/DUF883 family membrane-anchored ribosome-binding protein